LKENNFKVTLENVLHVSVDKIFDYAPFEKMAISKTAPSGIAKQLQNWNSVSYSSLQIGLRRVFFAVAENGPGYKGVYCILDRNGNKDLSDDQPKLWKLLVSNNESDEPDCDIRQCFIRDTLYFDKQSFVIDFQLGNYHQEDPFLLFRRGDALVAEMPIAGKMVKTALWDRCFSDFTDLRAVQVAIDKNGDRSFSSTPGDAEMLETALFGFNIDSMNLEIDTIYNGGNSVVFSKKASTGSLTQNSSEGAWAADFKTYYAKPVSLYSEISNHPLVVLYFFEGNSHDMMESADVKVFMNILRNRAGDVKLIGINRKTTGVHYENEIVIEENSGWRGDIVQKFHNHLEREIICIDNTGTILSRGAIGHELLQNILQKLGVKDPEKDLSQF